MEFTDKYLIALYLVAALGAFLIGFKLLSENLQKVANKGLRKLFDKTSKSKVAGVGIGVGATVLMQSSGATTVMVIGFVNAGMMSLYQATAVIMGANIGTTITTILIAVGVTSVGKYFMVFSFVGIFLSMLLKNGKAKSWSLTLAGFGLVFFGLTIISACSNGFKDNETIKNLLCSSIKPAFIEPIVLMLIGAIITAIMQSSTAVNAILLSLVSAGIQIGSGGNAILYIVLGTNIGTCVTALISSLGATTNAKRSALIHFLFNFFGSVIFLIILMIWKDFMSGFWVNIISTAEMQLALFHLAVFLLTAFAERFEGSGVFRFLKGSQLGRFEIFLVFQHYHSPPSVNIFAEDTADKRITQQHYDKQNKAYCGRITHLVTDIAVVESVRHDRMYLIVSRREAGELSADEIGCEGCNDLLNSGEHQLRSHRRQSDVDKLLPSVLDSLDSARLVHGLVDALEACTQSKEACAH